MAGTARAIVQLMKTISKSKSPIREGERIHCYAVKAGFGSNQHVGTALVTFYAIAGSAVAARNLFDEIPQPGLVAWTAMVRAYVVLARPTDKPHNFEPEIYNMERGARDKLISDYNTMDMWDFNEKHGELWDFTVKRDNLP